MQTALSPAACLFLRQLALKVAAKGRVKKTTSQKAVQEVLSWCLTQQLSGVSASCLQRPEFYFESGLLKQIAGVQQALGQPDFRIDISTLSRTDAANISTIEQKSIGIKPRQQRVLVSLAQPQLVAGIAEPRELDAKVEGRLYGPRFWPVKGQRRLLQDIQEADGGDDGCLWLIVQAFQHQAIRQRGHRGETRDLDQMIQRVESDIEYINNWSLWLDLFILARTTMAFSGKNAY